MIKKIAKAFVKLFGYSMGVFIAIFLILLAWSAAAGVYEPKFGKQWGTFQICIAISLAVAVIEAVVFFIVQSIWVLILRSVNKYWISHCGLLLFLLTAIVLPYLSVTNDLLARKFIIYMPIITSLLMIVPFIKQKTEKAF